jgi:2-methylcitrate dehydratase PrpD
VKPYPVVASIHGTLDSLRVLVPSPIPAAAIRRVIISVPPLALSHGGAVQLPADTLSAQFSFAFAVAVWVLTGTVDVTWFEDTAFRQSAEVAAICSAVQLEADPALSPDAQQGGATVRVEFADGNVRTHAQPVPTGRPDNPLGPQEMRARFDRLTIPVLGPDRSARLHSALRCLKEAPSVDELTALLRAGGHDGR